MDPVATANQPLVGEGELAGLQMIHNGEIYNFRELYAALEADGYTGKPVTSVDSEVVMHCYKHWGADKTIRALRGMFAIVLIDENTGDYLVARDHVGIKPLYRGVNTAGDQGFSSELKVICDQFDDFELFLPGHYATREHLVKYYQPEWDSPSFNPVTYSTPGEVRDCLKRAVRMRMMSDVPYGALLSGGLDSCIVTSLMLEISKEEMAAAAARGESGEAWYTFHTGGKLKTFTVGMEGSPDIMASRAMSKALGSEHHERLFTAEDGIEQIRKVVYHMETYEPELIRSSITNMMLAEMTAQHVKTVVTGEGADEAFCGYQYFKDAPTVQQLDEESKRIYHHLHCVNLQRSDRMGMAHSLEARVPFLDIDFLQVAYSVDPSLKLIREDGMEKKFLRDCFHGSTPIPDDLLYRTKAMQCEGVGMDWVSILQQDIESKMSDEHFALAKQKYTINPPHSKEECLYRDLFEEFFPSQDKFVHVWEGGCRAGGASWKSDKYTRAGLCDTKSLHHGFMPTLLTKRSPTDVSKARASAQHLQQVN